MSFALGPISIAETARMLAYLILSILFWRHLRRRQRNNQSDINTVFLKIQVLFFIALTLSQSAEVLLIVALLAGEGSNIFTIWHIYYRLVFLFWGVSILIVYWTISANWLKRKIRDWINSQITNGQA